MAVSFTGMFAHMIRRNLLVTAIDPVVGKRAIRRFGLGTLAYPAATIAGLLWPPLILVAIGALALYYARQQATIGSSDT